VLPEPEAPFPVDEFSVVLLQEGRRRAAYEPAEIQRLLNEHLRFNLGLAADGRLLTAGAVIDPGPGPRCTGLGFSRLAASELGELIAQDPSVQAGVESYRIGRFITPKGSVLFPSERRSA